GGGLFAYPAQSNFSGVRHPLSLLADAKARGWTTFLDAASFLPTADLRLDQHSPDFLALSMYKIAGYPTGLGALVARHEALGMLRRPSFAGGAVDWVSVQKPRHRIAHGPEGFEDGTASFLAAGAVAPALEQLQQIGRDRLATHLCGLTQSLLSSLASLRHGNGRPVVVIHGPSDSVDRGATVALTLHTPDGDALPYWEIEDDARRASLAMRGGCFCNPGCAERAFDFPTERMQSCFDELGDRFTIPGFAHCLGESSVGAIRISLGLGSVAADVSRAIAFISRYVCA
ncbi:MAG: aminotransferase class V-fold PLP-dependent enzyme, partial [Gemmatimonadaceae bacterium]